MHAGACVYAEALPAASAAPEQLHLGSFAALSLPVPQLPTLLDVLSFLLHNPPVTLVAAFAIAYLVSSAWLCNGLTSGVNLPNLALCAHLEQEAALCSRCRG